MSTLCEARSAAIEKSNIRGFRQGEPCDEGDVVRQVFCHGCLVLAHECCLLKIPVAGGLPLDTFQYCPPCASRIVKKRVKKAEKAEEAANIAEEHVKRIEAVVKEAEENYKNARETSDRAKQDALDFKELLARARFLRGADQGLCRHRRLEKAVRRDRQVNFDNQLQRMSGESSPSTPVQNGASLLSLVGCKEAENPVATEAETVELSPPEKLVSSPTKAKGQVSVRHPTLEKESRTIYGSPQCHRSVGLNGTGGCLPAGLTSAPVVPGTTQFGAGDLSSFVPGVEAEQSVDGQSHGMGEERPADSTKGPSVETVPVAKGPIVNFTRALAHEGRDEDERDGVRSITPEYSSANCHTSQAPQSNLMEVEVDMGDVRIGVVEEDHDRMAANFYQGSKGAEQLDDGVSAVPEAESRSRRRLRAIHGPPQGIVSVGLNGTVGCPGLTLAPAVPRTTHRGGGYSSSSVPAVHSESFDGQMGKRRRRADSPRESSAEIVLTTSVDFNRASAHEERNEVDSDEATSSSLYHRAKRCAAAAPQSNVMEVELVEDVHSDVLEDDHDQMAADADKSEGAEQPDGGISAVPEAESRPTCRVYRPCDKIPGVRRKNLPWTSVEVEALKEGVGIFFCGGVSQFDWKKILEAGLGKFHLSRTAVDLKDKWRNMKKSGAV